MPFVTTDGVTEEATSRVTLVIHALNLTPHSRCVILRDTGHWVPFERPAEYSAHVMTFLAG